MDDAHAALPRSLSTLSQNFEDSFSPIHIPSMSLFPIEIDANDYVSSLVDDRVVLFDLEVDRFHKDNDIYAL